MYMYLNINVFFFNCGPCWKEGSKHHRKIHNPCRHVASFPKGIFSNPEIFKILIRGGGGGDRNLYIRKTKEDISVVFIHIFLVRTEDQRRHSNRVYSYTSLNFFSVINIVDRVGKLLFVD